MDQMIRYDPLFLLCILFFSFDGEKYESISDSIVSHRQTFGLANYKGQALTVGCSRNEDSDFNGEEKCSFKDSLTIMKLIVLCFFDRFRNIMGFERNFIMV